VGRQQEKTVKDCTKEKKINCKLPLNSSGNREGINEHHLPMHEVPTACVALRDKK
jgi:hypothetical protein